MTYRENFKIQDIGTGIKGGAGAAGTGIKDTAGAAGTGLQTAGKSIMGLPNEAMRKVFGPVWDWLLKVWGWFKYVCSLLCCLCVLSCCMSLGIPQMMLASWGTPDAGAYHAFQT
jgi:hypothetical protein